ncbi:MAG: hypothetical protein F6K04_20080 [Leptolyngbya sp. SIO4C5]|uniref:hypothetical protein n=1 Tax=Sphaerothrix gracilis TaxID=3151835 RepID=UPI0013C00CE5|nr:hypothetical protein [Leptolyngbya sp. SIO4C5]
MPWLILLSLALILTSLGRYLTQADEVYAIAVYSAGILSALWGLAIAPSTLLLSISIVAFGWLQMSSLASE